MFTDAQNEVRHVIAVREQQLVGEEQIGLRHLKACHSHGEEEGLQQDTLHLLGNAQRKGAKCLRHEAPCCSVATAASEPWQQSQPKPTVAALTQWQRCWTVPSTQQRRTNSRRRGWRCHHSQPQRSRHSAAKPPRRRAHRRPATAASSPPRARNLRTSVSSISFRKPDREPCTYTSSWGCTCSFGAMTPRAFVS